MMRVVLCNCSPEESESLARGLVEEGHAACVNILPGVTSVYEWEGEVHQETEDTLLIKTTDEGYEATKQWIREHHSYDVPEIVALEAVDVLDEYVDWVGDQVNQAD